MLFQRVVADTRGLTAIYADPDNRDALLSDRLVGWGMRTEEPYLWVPLVYSLSENCLVDPADNQNFLGIVSQRMDDPSILRMGRYPEEEKAFDRYWSDREQEDA